MEHQTTTPQSEAERLLGVSAKLLGKKDYSGCKDFGLLAQENNPLLEGTDQILAVADVLLASSKKIQNHHDWYAILQIGGRTDDLEKIKKQYRRLVLLLHPDKNKFEFSDVAFGLVADAWAVLSDPAKKALFDNEISLFQKVDLVPKRKPTARKPASADASHKLQVRRSSRGSVSNNNNKNSNDGNENNNNFTSQNINTNTGGNNQSGGEKVNPKSGSSGVKSQRSTFWSVCPYCYNLYEYERQYVGCCLRCENCEKAFTAVEIRQMPPQVPGKNAYYCCWGFFPMGFVVGSSDGKNTSTSAAVNGFPNWMPQMFPGGVGGGGGGEGGGGAPATTTAAADGASAPTAATAPTGVERLGEVGVGNANVMGFASRGAAPPMSANPIPTPPHPVSGGPKKRGRPRKNPL